MPDLRLGWPRGLHRNFFFLITFIVHNQKLNGGPIEGGGGGGGMSDRSNNPSHHEQTLYHAATSRATLNEARVSVCRLRVARAKSVMKPIRQQTYPITPDSRSRQARAMHAQLFYFRVLN